MPSTPAGLWLSSVGYLQVFLTAIGAKAVVFFAVWTATAVILWLNGLLAVRPARRQPTQATAASAWTPTGNVPPSDLFTFMRERLPWSRAIAGGAGLLALLVAAAEVDNWGAFLQFLYHVHYGADDPLYNKDIGFYLFHHANPDGAVLTIFWQIWICFALVYLIAGGAFVAGALVAYAWYLFVHHCAHHGPDKLPLPLLKHYQSHHRFASRNYGVSTTLWDHVFGTMLR